MLPSIPMTVRLVVRLGSNFADRSMTRLTPTKPIPNWLDKLCQRLVDDKYFPVKPDQIIINEYAAGQGIAPHMDHAGSFEEWIVSISLASAVTMNFQNYETKGLCTTERSSLRVQRNALFTCSLVLCFY